MYRTFTVDGLVYELTTTPGNNLLLAIVDGASRDYKPPYDPFDDWYQDPYVVDDIGSQRYPIRVYRRAMAYVMEWLGSQRPGFFAFRANTSKRVHLYHRAATTLSNRFGYQWHEYEGWFYFYPDHR